MVLTNNKMKNNKVCIYYLTFISIYFEICLTIMIGDISPQSIFSTIDYLFNFFVISQQLKINQTGLISEKKKDKLIFHVQFSIKNVTERNTGNCSF